MKTQKIFNWLLRIKLRINDWYGKRKMLNYL